MVEVVISTVVEVEWNCGCKLPVKSNHIHF